VSLYTARPSTPHCFSTHSSLPLPHLHSFPTRRSSDLPAIDHHAALPGQISGKNNVRLALGNGGGEFQRERANREASSALIGRIRSEEHTSELQSRGHLVCRLLLEKKNKKKSITEPLLL